MKVVAPNQAAKEHWQQMAVRDGFRGNVSGWIKHVLAAYEAGDLHVLEERAAQADVFAQRVQELEREVRMLRDAYEKGRIDLRGMAEQNERLLGAITDYLAATEQIRERSHLMLTGLAGAFTGKNGRPRGRPPLGADPVAREDGELGQLRALLATHAREAEQLRRERDTAL